MGRWDVVLPFLAPGRGGVPEGRRSRRVEESPRSRSPSASSSASGLPTASDSGSDRLPNVEDIYDLLTAELADLEERLGRKSSSGILTPKEEKLHELVRVELGERRSVEEIGLALIGGRFDLANVPGLLEQRPVRSPAVQPPEGAEVWTLPDERSPASSSRSSFSMRATSPSPWPEASPGLRNGQRSPKDARLNPAPVQTRPSQPSQGFKPTPVNFDFVIGTSSVRKKVARRKPKEPKESKDPARKAAPKKRVGQEAATSRNPKAPGLPRTRAQNSKPAKASEDRPAQGYPHSAEVNEPDASGEDRHETSSCRDTKDLKEPAELTRETADELASCSMGTAMFPQTHTDQRQEFEADGQARDRRQQPEPMSMRQGSEATGSEADGQAAGASGIQQEDADPDSVALETAADIGEDLPEEGRPAGAGLEEPQHSGEETLDPDVDEGLEEAAEADEQQDVLTDKGEDSPASSNRSRRSKVSGGTQGPEPAFAEQLCDQDEPDPSGVPESRPRTSTSQGGPASESRPASAVSRQDACQDVAEVQHGFESEAASPSVQSPVVQGGAQGEAAAKEASPKLEKTPKPRKPPLPHDALKALPTKGGSSRANELEYVGLDPKLVERGEIRKYHEIFPSFTDIFTWGRSQEVQPQRERYLRESLQLFAQFCNIIGSLEVQFTTKLGPADHSTPNATHQALNAMASRGAGLYGVFLKGIIDKMDADACNAAVPRPLPVETDVYSLRYYKVVQNRTEVYDIVTRVFHRKEGWEELPHGLGLSNAWNLCWTWSKPKLDYSRLCVWQKVNHFPENKHLTRKDFLKRCIDRYTRTGGKLAQYFNICPRTFVLPKEYCLFIECFTKIAEENGDLEGSSPPSGPKVPNMWIMKPAGSSRGRGIQVINDVSAVHYGELTIIQQYISDPFLLGDFKWDMRTYVTVTSFNPLEAFVYKDGFARFTTVPYNTSGDDIDNKFVHLTNSSIQRHNEENFMHSEDGSRDTTRREEAILGGTKISFPMLRERLEAVGIDWAVVWRRMVEVILKSLCMAEDFIPNQVNSFELFGYDLLMDSKMKVWLIEVNSSPSMGQEHLLDEHVKQPLISDTIDLVEPLEFDRRRLADVLHRRVERKAATGAAGGRQQLDIDLHAVLKGQVPRKYGELPQYMGNYERIAPSEAWDNIVRSRSLLFNRVGSSS